MVIRIQVDHTIHIIITQNTHILSDNLWYELSFLVYSYYWLISSIFLIKTYIFFIKCQLY